MLNRIYIVVGLLAIMALAVAFIAPRFIQWGDYRDRMEVLAEGVFGTEVTIRGGIDFALLPEPRLSFSDVVIGPADRPDATVGSIEARFALMDFLRDRYNLSALVVNSPTISLSIDENGFLTNGIDLSGAGNGVALNQARIDGGRIVLTDLRANTTYDLTDIQGELRLGSFSGPFQFQGSVDYAGMDYGVRLNSGLVDESGSTRVSAFITETAGRNSLTLEGLMEASLAPKFDGTMVLRQSPPQVERAEEIRGNLVLESKVTASTDRVVLNGYTLLPDENRAGMRLTGAASIQLGARSRFEAVISGGVFALPPRSAEEVASEHPYEIVRLLSELPAPPLPPIPGQVGIDLAEIGLRGAALRNVRVDASTNGSNWIVDRAHAELAGNSQIRMSGILRNEEGRVGFSGDLEVATSRLDALTQLWRKASEDSPLFSVPATLSGQVMLAGEALGFNHGRLDLNGRSHALEVRLGFGAEPRLDLVGRFTDLTPADSTILAAMLPDPSSDSSFAVSFPQGSFSFNSQAIRLLGLDAKDMQAEGSWSGQKLQFSRLASSDWGGLDVNVEGTLAGTLTRPLLNGSGKIALETAAAPALPVLYEALNVPEGWRRAISLSVPASVDVRLEPGDTAEAQKLTLGGTAGVAQVSLSLEMAGGLAEVAADQLRIVGSMEADDGAGLVEQLGLGANPLFGGSGEAMLSLYASGDVPSGFEGRLAINQGEEFVAFGGEVSVLEGGQLSGKGIVDIHVLEGAGLPELFGASGIGLGGFEASAGIEFLGVQSVALSGIAGKIEGAAFSGDLAIGRVAQLPSVSGSLSFDRLPGEGLAAALFSPAALVPGDDIWPVGPLAASAQARPTRGTIGVAVGEIGFGSTKLADAQFDLSWDQQNLKMSGLKGRIGGGTLTATLGNCCSGPLADRTITGSLSLDNVYLTAIAPTSVTDRLAGRLSGSFGFKGTGASLDEVVSSLAGEGNLSFADLWIAGFNPGVYPAIAGLNDVLNIDEEALTILVDQALGRNAFEASSATGAFTIAGGTLRLANFIIEGAGARLSGGLSAALPSLGIEGSFVMTPLNFSDTTGLIEPETARIVARLSGMLWSPEVQVDVSEMVAAVQVRANELEVDRLEALRIENEARQREAAAERNRLAEEQRRKAAEEAAARAAAEEEARQQELQRQPVSPAVEPFDMTPDSTAPNGPLDLGFQPGVNGFGGAPVNQPVR